jgi:hypothetical protein
MNLSDLLFLIAPYLFLAAGLFLFSIAVYAAGAENLTCSWKGGRLNCVVERFRILGMKSEERIYAINVIDVFIRSSTTDTTYFTPAKNRFTTSSTNDTIILRTKGGEDIATLGGGKAMGFAGQIEKLLKNSRAGPLTLIDSNWPFAYACGGFSLVFFLFGSAAAYYSKRGL